MDRHARLGLSCFLVVTLTVFEGSAVGQLRGEPPGTSNQAAAWSRPEIIVLGALRANPVTAPYGIMTSWKKGAVVLSGRVGTKAIHDIAVRTAIDLGYPIHDDLVIDTGAAQQVALSRTAQMPWTAGPWGNTAGSAPYIVYPPPLFGRVDDPLFGLEPPLVSFPPWARAKALESQVRRAGYAPGQVPMGQPLLGQPLPGAGLPGPAPAMGTGQQPAAAAENDSVKGKVQLTVDMAGQVFLTGVVASEEARRIIEEEASNTPGVSRVYSNLRVATQAPAPAQTQAPAPAQSTEAPPPPPQPFVKPEPEAKPSEPSPPARPQQPAPASQPQPQLKPPAAGPGSSPQPKAQASRPAAAVAMAHDTQKLTHRVA
ncbi:MAG: BON domain-containing protein, partial [Isosphaeraceae bacterium]